MIHEYWYQAKVVSVHDGDTATLNIDMGRRIHIVDAVRFYRINAPELSQTGGKEARDYLRLIIGTDVRLQTHKNAEDKYGRWLADVWTDSHGEEVCINDLMVSAGHAVYYPARAKQ